MNKLIFTILFFVVFIPCAFSDSLILNNGREIEGKIESEDENEVKMDIGIGVVGFDKSQIAEIKRASEDEQDELEDKLEERRKEAAETAAENEKWAEKQERRENLISSKKEQTKQDIQSRREEILKKRREQLKRLREKREQAAMNPEQSSSSAAQSVPPPPPVPTMNTNAEPLGVATPQPSVPSVEDREKQIKEEEKSLRGSRRVHRLGNRRRSKDED